MSRIAFPLISIQRFKVELSFVTERVVEALSSDVHGSEQVLGRSRGVAFRPESARSAVQCFVSIELSGPDHGLTILVIDRSVNIDSALSPLQTGTALRTSFGLGSSRREMRTSGFSRHTDAPGQNTDVMNGVP